MQQQSAHSSCPSCPTPAGDLRKTPFLPQTRLLRLQQHWGTQQLGQPQTCLLQPLPPAGQEPPDRATEQEATPAHRVPSARTEQSCPWVPRWPRSCQPHCTACPPGCGRARGEGRCVSPGPPRSGPSLCSCRSAGRREMQHTTGASAGASIPVNVLPSPHPSRSLRAPQSPAPPSTHLDGGVRLAPLLAGRSWQPAV